MAIRSLERGDLLRRRVERVFWIIVLCYVALLARLAYLQGVQGPALKREAEEKRTQTIRVRAHRGSIYDRDGRLLAVSLYSGTVGFDPSQAIPDAKDAADPRKVARLKERLARSQERVAALLHLPPAALDLQVRRACLDYTARRERRQRDPKAPPPSRFVVIQRAVPIEVGQQLEDANLLGFGVVDGSRRVYASAENTAQVVGFLGPDGAGAAGLERACGRWLNGQDGSQVAEVDSHLREIPGTQRQVVPAQDGLNVNTTLDATAQHIAMEAAQRIVEEHHPKGVSIVIVEPATGDVRALVSMPSFDPNPGKRRSLTGEALAERCAARLYEPGSTLKALTIAGALDNGTITQQSGFYCSGQLTVGNKIIHCVLHGASERYGHGYETPEDILRHSCNVGAAQVGLKMGPKALYEADRRFGLFDRLELGLPAEQHGRLSFDPKERIYTPAKAARVAFGHSITTTPLHVALAYAAIANGGVVMKPRLVTSVTEASTGKVRQAWEPQAVRRALSPQTSAQVTAMLRAVVSNGTGKVVALPGYQIAGKTGTANKYRRGAYVGSFIGFFPAGPTASPRVVILVAVDEPQGLYFGAEVAAPAFRTIARRLATYWHIPEDDPEGVQARTAAENLRRAGQTPLQTTSTMD